MARIRTIKPEFWIDEDLSELSAEAHLFAAALLNHCDDEGYFKANPKLLHAQIFALRECSGSVPDHLKNLEEIGYLRLFSGSDGKQYGCVKNFNKHQSINKPTASKIKPLEEIPDNSGSTTGEIPAGKERKGKEQGKEKKDTSENKFSDEHMKFAVGMFKLIRQVAPTAKEPNFEKWADDIRLINERDNRTLEEIGKVFRFANSDSFWKTNILSPAKLREKYTELHTKMINQPQKTASIFDLQNKIYVSGDL